MCWFCLFCLQKEEQIRIKNFYFSSPDRMANMVSLLEGTRARISLFVRLFTASKMKISEIGGPITIYPKRHWGGGKARADRYYGFHGN